MGRKIAPGAHKDIRKREASTTENSWDSELEQRSLMHQVRQTAAQFPRSPGSCMAITYLVGLKQEEIKGEVNPQAVREMTMGGDCNGET